MERLSTDEVRLKLVPLALQVGAALVPYEPLDYTPESVRTVERALGALHEEFARSGSDDGFSGIALEFAAYIVEVVDRNFGPVEWERDDAEFGVDAFPMRWRGGTIYPYAWCEKRLFNGTADDVWAKFSALVLEAQRDVT
jgi:hypothetical protein